MTMFRISGIFEKPLRKIRFSIEVEANSQKVALEKAYSIIGSKHRVKRENIKILSIEEVKPETK